jgi:glycosyltransferase involved in cell wall biosynthesis
MPSLVSELFSVGVDVFHANFPSPYIASTVAMASHIRRIPAVLTWHNDLPPVTALAGLIVRTHDDLILPRYIRGYRRIIATSETYAKQSRILTTFGGFVTVIPNGVDCKLFHPDVNPERLKAQLQLGGKFTVIFVGALTKWHRYKGLDVLLGAMKIALEKQKGLRLLIVGDGELREEYRRTAAGLGISVNVSFLGDVPDATLPECYAASDIAVIPSKDQSEGFGLTILEANATGKPVIASNVGGVPSVVTHGYNGLLVPPTDSSSLAEAILYLSKNRDAAAAMGRNGRKVAEEHDWKKTAALTERVYADVLAA